MLAFPGEPGSFAEDAAVAWCPGAEVRARPSPESAVAAVVAAEVDGAVLPIESLVHGTVREVCDVLLGSPVHVVGEVVVPVRLCLAGLPGARLEDITQVLSHVQALSQAEPFLRARPWTLLAATNTAGAGRTVAERHDPATAAVCSPRAADLLGLEVLAPDIQADPRNRTRFLVVAAQAAPDWAARPGAPRSAVAFSVRNEPGSLHRVLGILVAHEVNLSKLESRPSRERAWEYVFWAEIDADLAAPAADGLRTALDEATVAFRVLGTYRRAEPDR